jgi:hypothetical protein
MAIAEVKRYVDLAQRGDATILERLRLLEEHNVAIEN